MRQQIKQKVLRCGKNGMIIVFLLCILFTAHAEYLLKIHRDGIWRILIVVKDVVWHLTNIMKRLILRQMQQISV